LRLLGCEKRLKNYLPIECEVDLEYAARARGILGGDFAQTFGCSLGLPPPKH
jgi:hypothetical protein